MHQWDDVILACDGTENAMRQLIDRHVHGRANALSRSWDPLVYTQLREKCSQLISKAAIIESMGRSPNHAVIEYNGRPAWREKRADEKKS